MLILHMAIKDLRLLSKDAMSVFFIIGFPVIMGLFFGFIGMSFSSDDVQFEIAIVDNDNSEMSHKFIENLTEDNKIVVHHIERETALENVRKGKLAGVIIIPKGYGETAGMMWMEAPAIELGIDPSQPATGAAVQGMIMGAAGKMMSDRFADPESMRPTIQQYKNELANDPDITPAMRIPMNLMLNSLDNFMGTIGDVYKQADAEAETDDLESAGKNEIKSMQIVNIKQIDVTGKADNKTTNEQENSDNTDENSVLSKIRSPWDISFPSAIMWGVMGCAAGFAVSLVRERTKGTLIRLQVAPITMAHILAGKGFACFIAVILVVGFMITLGSLPFMGISLDRPDLLALAAVSVALCFVGIMMLMSVIAKTEEAVSGASWGVNVIMAMFGGGMMPLAFLPKFMQTISHFSPVKWGVLALEGAIWRGFTLMEMLPICGVLIAIGFICYLLGVSLMLRTR